MTAALLRATNTIDFTPERGVSIRTVRSVLKLFARLSAADGSLRYGLRASKVAQLTEISLATARRAEKYLVDHGYLERVEVGGGRKSTKWKVNVERLIGSEPRAASDPLASADPPPREPPPGRKPSSLFSEMFSRGRSGMSPPVLHECHHGGDSSDLPNGMPRCAMCRREVLRS